MELSITNAETTVLIFPTAIKSVDRGSKEILSKVVSDVTNVLKVKAASENITPTNLHVFTADGKVYSFLITYNQAPANLTIDFTNKGNDETSVAKIKYAGSRLNDYEIEKYADAILNLKRRHSGPHSAKIGNAQLSLSGAYLKEGTLFFQFVLKNKASMPYQPDFIRCYIRDKKKTKRSSVTEREVQPLFTRIDTEIVATSSRPISFVLALRQFTIADGKFLAIEAFEKNGDRILTCELKGKDLLRVKKLPL